MKNNDKVRKLPPCFSGSCPSIFVLQHPIIIADSPAASAGGRRLSCVSRWRVCGVLSHFLPYRANANFSSVLKSRHLSTEINIATSPPPYRIVFHRSVAVRFGRCPGGFFFSAVFILRYNRAAILNGMAIDGPSSVISPFAMLARMLRWMAEVKKRNTFGR